MQPALKKQSLKFCAGQALPTYETLRTATDVVLCGLLSLTEVSFFKMAQMKYHFTLVNGDEEAAKALDPPEE